MTIHHVIDNLEIGGAETLLLSMCELQKQNGHEVTVHGLFGGGPLVDRFEKAGIQFISHQKTAKYGLPLALYRAFERDRPKVVNFHNVTPTVHGAIGAKLAGVKAVVSTRHGASSHSPRRERKFWFSARFVDKVVITSAIAEDDFRKDPWTDPTKLFPIHNGAVIRSDKQPEGNTDQFEFDESGLTLIAVGRMHPVKDFGNLIRAVSIASQSIPHLRLRILGDGNERPQIEQLILDLNLQDRVQLLGMRSDVGYWLSRSDLFLLSSKSEGIPVSLLEAMAWGVPCIATSVGGIPEVLNLSQSGLTVPPENSKALAEAIVRFAGFSSAKKEQMGKLARQCYEKHFTIRQTVRRYMDLYSHCIESKAKSLNRVQ